MMQIGTKRLIGLAGLGLAVCGALSACDWAALGQAEGTVSQQGRRFTPSSIHIERNQGIVVVNDDGAQLHHAYVDSIDFSFDSGDQKPGSRTRIVFPVTGDFKVLCGIHPKMKLLVHVH